MKKKYWRSLKEKGSESKNTKRQEPEFSIDNLSDQEIKNGFKSNRRSFLKALGFSLGYATLASSCEQPVRKAIPYLNKPEEVTPGIANHYASTYFDGHDYCSVVVKVRDGRPIKIEGNEMFPFSNGGTNARVQASVLDLYDGSRLQNPKISGTRSDWDTNDNEIIEKLRNIKTEDGKIVLLTSSVISPSTLAVFEEFKKEYPSTEIVFYDAVSQSALLDANNDFFGVRALPHYRFDKAKVIAGFNADFLGTWIDPIEFAGQYSIGRDLLGGQKELSKHYQFESYLSVTGSSADKRFPIKPSDERIVLLNLFNILAERLGWEPIATNESVIKKADLEELAKNLLAHSSESLVVSGSNDFHNQLLVNAINSMLKNIGTTVDFESPTYRKRAGDQNFYDFVKEMNNGDVKGLIVYNANPVYDSGLGDEFISGMKKTDLTISLAKYNDETTNHIKYSCPDHHYLESWNDAQPYKGHYTLAQPCVHSIFNTRQAQDSLLKWIDRNEDFHSFMQGFWKEKLYTKQTEYFTFESFWKHTLQNGFFVTNERHKNLTTNKNVLYQVKEHIRSIERSNNTELVLYENTGIGTGNHANNPWLQELPDPVSKVTWGNYLAVSPGYAQKHNLKQEDVVRVNGAMKLPVCIQPGQPDNTVSVAMGYGRTRAGKTGNGVGANAFRFVSYQKGRKRYFLEEVSLDKTGEKDRIASTQDHHTMEGREMVKETDLKDYQKNPASGNESHAINMQHADTMYPKKEFPGAHWGMSIDLNKCIGCSACVIACQAENNIPVVGKQEVINRRIMHWMRIDRYYTSEEGKDDYQADNPQVLHQPVMCQHCDNAPCENVCPVAATPHTKEGLNSMAYNRCIGTRYCMNNCPYSVRRFNWYSYVNNKEFDYNMSDKVSKLALNPDVTVRSRGVVEKCSFCIQRIQEKKLEAKKEGRPLRDSEVQPACVQACPTKAITFGDHNLEGAEISKHVNDQRAYGLLEELHTLPSVVYLTKVRNQKKK